MPIEREKSLLTPTIETTYRKTWHILAYAIIIKYSFTVRWIDGMFDYEFICEFEFSLVE